MKRNYLLGARRRLFCATACWSWCVIAGCGFNMSDKVRRLSDYDVAIVPLVDSYELVRLNGMNNWSLSLKNKPGSAENIDSAGLVGHLILVHSTKSYTRDTLENACWFVLNAPTHTEKQFKSHKAYRQYLMTQKINSRALAMKEVSQLMQAAKLH